ncbi:MAG: dihydrodipicolinate synthase family protein [Turicibacter sp.]|nr:dihydrodipicolinate synthase family protein [Turicibacter sp.]
MKNYSVLLASFDENGKLDEEGVKEIIRFNREMSRVDGLFINGTGGESFIMDLESRKRMLHLAAENASDYSLYAQIGCSNYHEVLELAECAKHLNYEAVGILLPQYSNILFSELKGYFERLAPEIDMPIYLYYFPGINRVVLDAEQIGELLQLPNIVGLKYTDTNFKLAEQVRRNNPDKKLLMGYDEFVTFAALIGFDGAIGISFNILGQPISTITKFADAGDFISAQMLQSKLNAFLEKITPNTLQNMRMIINHYGYRCKFSKLPLASFVPHSNDTIKAYEDLLDYCNTISTGL